jgi:hypothetical protein
LWLGVDVDRGLAQLSGNSNLTFKTSGAQHD